MKLLITLISAALVAVLGYGPAQDGRSGDDELPVVKVGSGERVTLQPQLADLGFLAGSWLGSDGTSTWESLYSSADGGQIVGASKELRDGRTVMIDFEHFYERSGQLRMTPFPFGERSVEFTLSGFDAERREAIFENLEHDFPKQFTYRRASEDQLLIKLVGELNGSELIVELDLKPRGR